MFSQLFDSIINFFSANIFWFNFFSLLISGIALAIILFFNIKLNLTGEKVEHWIDVWHHKSISQKRSLRAWKKIEKRLRIGNLNQLRLAVLEADRILDQFFKLAGYPGQNLDERLEEATDAQLVNIEEIRQVHKLRNRIASEPDFELTPGETEIAIGIYKSAFIDLGILEESE